MTQEIGNLNNPVSIKEITSVIKSPSIRKTPNPDNFSTDSCKHIRNSTYLTKTLLQNGTRATLTKTFQKSNKNLDTKNPTRTLQERKITGQFHP